MSGFTTLHCPHCMAEAPKRVAVVPAPIIDRYQCPVCGWHGLREELVKETKLNVLRSGKNPPAPRNFSFDFAGSVFDPGAGNPGFLETSPPFTPDEGEILVVCAGNDDSGTIDSVSFGGSAMTLASSGSVSPTNLGVQFSGSMWYLLNPPQTSSVVTAFLSGPPTYTVMAVFRVSAGPTFISSAENHSDVDTTIFSAGAAVALNLRDLKVGMIVHDDPFSGDDPVFDVPDLGYSTDLSLKDPLVSFGLAVGHSLAVPPQGLSLATQGTHDGGSYVAIVAAFR
jgi:hypothetical protein